MAPIDHQRRPRLPGSSYLESDLGPNGGDFWPASWGEGAGGLSIGLGRASVCVCVFSRHVNNKRPGRPADNRRRGQRFGIISLRTGGAEGQTGESLKAAHKQAARKRTRNLIACRRGRRRRRLGTGRAQRQSGRASQRNSGSRLGARRAPGTSNEQRRDCMRAKQIGPLINRPHL